MSYMASTPFFGTETKLSMHLHGATSVRLTFNQGIDRMLILFTASVVLLGAMVALPACFLCISRRLEVITSPRGCERRQSKTYETTFEAATCFLLPCLYMGLRASHWCLVADITKLITMQTQLFRIVALLYSRISAARQQSKILFPP